MFKAILCSYPDSGIRLFDCGRHLELSDQECCVHRLHFQLRDGYPVDVGGHKRTHQRDYQEISRFLEFSDFSLLRI